MITSVALRNHDVSDNSTMGQVPPTILPYLIFLPRQLKAHKASGN